MVLVVGIVLQVRQNVVVQQLLGKKVTREYQAGHDRQQVQGQIARDLLLQAVHGIRRA